MPAFRAEFAAVVVATSLALACASSGSGMPASIGVVARREPSSGRVVIVDVPDGSAGAKAGLEPGDEIVAVDGVSVAKLSADDFHRAVRGEAGSRVVLDVRRDGLLHRISIAREPMRQKPEPKK